MVSNYSANVHNIRASSKHIDEISRGAERLGLIFQYDLSETDGCWVVEGEGDDLGESFKDQDEKETRAIDDTIRGITTGIMSLVEAVAREAEPVQRPQLNALEDINTAHAESEARR